MTTPHDTHELSGRQRLELAMLADELVNPARDYEPALADVIRFVAAEKITPAMFTPGERVRLSRGYLGALIIENRTLIAAKIARMLAG